MKQRDRSIDFLRATAIFLMVITHINALFYTGDSFILDIFTTAGATLCFSIFLFCTGYTNGLKILEEKKFLLSKTLKRVLEIYVIYILCAVFVSLVLNEGITLKEILNISVFNYVPGFTEFLIAFILFSFLPLLFSKQIKYLLQRPLILISISLLVYFVGIWIYNWVSEKQLPDALRIIAENLFGYPGKNRFPLLPYFPIYSFGLILSKYKKNSILVKTILISSFLFTFLYIFKLSHWHRWPPSFLFLTYALIYIPVVLLLYRKFKKFFTKKPFNLFTQTGKYPLEQFALSTLLIFILKAFIQPTGSEIVAVFLNILVLGILLIYPIVFRPKMV
jgi:hypothetical protein